MPLVDQPGSGASVRFEGVRFVQLRRRRNRLWANWLAFGTLIAVPLVAGIFRVLGSPSELVAWSGGATALSLLLSWSAAQSARWVKAAVEGAQQDGTLLLTTEGIRISPVGQAEQSVVAEQIEAGHVLADGSVVLRLWSKRDVRIDGLEPSQREHLLAHLGVGVSERAVELPIKHESGDHPLRRPGAGLSLLFATLALAGASSLPKRVVDLVSGGSSIGWAAFVTMLTLLCYGGVAAAARQVARRDRAVIGSDGVTIKRATAPVFVGYDAIDSLSRQGQELLIELKVGSTVRLGLQADSEGLEQRIRDAWQAWRKGGATRDLSSLDRRGRAAQQWREELRGVVGGADYRGARFEVDELLGLASDGSVAPEHRVAAAVAASSSGAEEVKRQLRIAADATADEDLRIALEQAAEAEIDDIALARAQERWAMLRHD